MSGKYYYLASVGDSPCALLLAKKASVKSVNRVVIFFEVFSLLKIIKLPHGMKESRRIILSNILHHLFDSVSRIFVDFLLSRQRQNKESN